MYDPQIHHRRSIRLKEYDYSKEGCYFITLCTINKECLFGEIKENTIILNKTGKLIIETWGWLQQQYTFMTIHEWTIMPNHLHAIIELKDTATKNLGGIIGAFKTVSTKKFNQIITQNNIQLWQRNYYEHIIRDSRSYDSIINYIRTNPERWIEDSLHP
ncbi:transposase [Bacteroides sp. 51]|uniref:transposase n=1 Tax=Bacteroides sp. 51 TaxID=2302938 RepID=UPI0013D7A3C3|nr:transposase [Bacteroides sp. 51]NDV83121.1 transposase [Bacteroides sp. 51]